MSDPAPLYTWLCEPLESPVARALERIRAADDVRHVAVMPDVHLAEDVCVGTVLATGTLLYPAAVGGDIGCGMLAVAFNGPAEAIRDPANAGKILRMLGEQIPGIRRHRRRTMMMPKSLQCLSLSEPTLKAVAKEEGAMQLGTLGGGNHFVELQADEEDRLWLMIHSGSRAMGQAIRALHLDRGERMACKMIALRSDESPGQAYLNDVEWARAYAIANREAMGMIVCQIIEAVLKVTAISGMTIGCDHNHVAPESHFGETLLVHRKGAMPAGLGVAGAIPGSMGTLSYHVVGKGHELSLRSSSHGAGRRFSRSEARETYRTNDLRQQMREVWYDPRLIDQLRDEAPRAYKDVRRVLDAEADLVCRTRTLKPLLVYKGV